MAAAPTESIDPGPAFMHSKPAFMQKSCLPRWHNLIFCDLRHRNPAYPPPVTSRIRCFLPTHHRLPYFHRTPRYRTPLSRIWRPACALRVCANSLPRTPLQSETRCRDVCPPNPHAHPEPRRHPLARSRITRGRDAEVVVLHRVGAPHLAFCVSDGGSVCVR